MNNKMQVYAQNMKTYAAKMQIYEKICKKTDLNLQL